MPRASGSEAFSWRRLEKLLCRSSHIFLFGRKFAGGIRVHQFYRASPVTFGFSPQLPPDGIECWRSGKMYEVIPGEDWNNAAEGYKPSASDFIRDYIRSENAYHILRLHLQIIRNCIMTSKKFFPPQQGENRRQILKGRQNYIRITVCLKSSGNSEIDQA